MAGATTTPTSDRTALDKQFDQTVKPFVTKYCVGCHSGPTAAAQFDLKSYNNLKSVTDDFPRWSLVLERVSAKEMPPQAVPQPPAEASQHVLDWIRAVRTEEVKRSAGDPGLVLARRLSNAEFNYTIRDLTGQNMDLTREFPIDPANPAGFDNSGESLTMSPALLNKYLQAARDVADHIVLKPEAFDFAPYSALAETDRDKYSIQRIISFYQSQPTDYADYFQAAWRYRYRANLGKPGATLSAIAAESKLSPKYLPMVWQILHDKDALGPVAKLQGMWSALPAPAAAKSEDVRAKCVEMRDFVVRIRQHTAMQFAAPVVKGLPPGSQPLLNWKLGQFAAHHRDSDPNDLRNDTDPPPVVPAIPRYPGLHQEAAPRWAALSAKARADDADLIVPAAQRKRYEAAFQRLASVFPDTFYITERGRYFPDDSQDKGRFLSAGYHSVMGYFRDDGPLMQLILDEKGQRELDRLWGEFEFASDFTARTFVQFYFNQSGEVLGHGAESSSPRPVDHQVTDEVVINQMRDAYLAKAAADPKNDPTAARAIREHFDHINATLRFLEKQRKEAPPKQLDAMLRFAERAWRRPLTKAEQTDLLSYYQTLRTKNELSHDDAIRGCVVSVLMAPDFLYRIDLLETASPSGGAGRAVLSKVSASKSAMSASVRPLPSYALASRLSYFLWSSMPDEELLRHAATGDLRKPDVLLAQARRMMKDDRVRGLATEFTGNWLDFRHFQTNNAVDRQRFPDFTNDLREAMFQEPIRFVEHAIRDNVSVLDLLYGNYTFVNPPLAKHYGMPDVQGDLNTWVRVDDAKQYQRGGVLPMAVFLTQNSPGLRTSPVKRGHWVVQKVLGETIPPPPPVVPELPNDEAKSDLPVREMLARHRENPMCASCHARFDSFGLALEGYSPVGGARTKDLAGRAIDASASYPGGTQGVGFEGLQTFIREHRQDQFVDNVSRKMLAYGLNRSLQLSDDSLLEQMEARLKAKDYRFDSLIEAIVTSPQFLTKRVPEPRETSETKSAKSQPRKGE